MMEAARTSETLVNFYQTTRCCNPEDSNLHTHRRENLKSYITEIFLDFTTFRKRRDATSKSAVKSNISSACKPDRAVIRGGLRHRRCRPWPRAPRCKGPRARRTRNCILRYQQQTQRRTFLFCPEADKK
jgi:hypothetical protein